MLRIGFGSIRKLNSQAFLTIQTSIILCDAAELLCDGPKLDPFSIDDHVRTADTDRPRPNTPSGPKP